MKKTTCLDGVAPRRRALAALLVGALGAAGSTAALAHGDGHAARPTPFDPAKVEETAYGRQGDPAKVTRSVSIAMNDNMRFTPSVLTVKRGETLRLSIVNKGRVLHELVLGTADELKKHAELMKRFPDMEHDEPQMAHVQAGKRGEIVWQFTQVGEFQFACLLPGHFEAGMVGTVIVK
jgi:uncharacterized cupredoxin-like copper-binding protein